MRRGGGGGPGEAGFTLIEVLVAMAVLGAVLATAYGVYASGLRNLGRGDERLTLALMAESLLDRAGLDLARAGGGAEGTLPDGVRWRVTRQPYDLERLREGLTVVEQPPPAGRRPGAGESLLDPAEGRPGAEVARAGDAPGRGAGGERRGGLGSAGLGSGGMGGGLNGGGSGLGSGGLSGGSAAGVGEQPGGGLGGGAGPGRAGQRGGGGGGSAPVKLKAWLVRVEVANARGESFALSRLSLERERAQ